MKEEKYYNFNDILRFLEFDYEFDRESGAEYPFNKRRESVTFSWGEILIPQYGIREIVANKLVNINARPISEIKMMYIIPFVEVTGERTSVGAICQDISLGFRYDKTYKYGEITKPIEECCFWILENAIRTNDFYVISGTMVQEFFSDCIINNQWGLGRRVVCSPPNEKFLKRVEKENERERIK